VADCAGEAGDEARHGLPSPALFDMALDAQLLCFAAPRAAHEKRPLRVVVDRCLKDQTQALALAEVVAQRRPIAYFRTEREQTRR
jgi:hypothetical protein